MVVNVQLDACAHKLAEVRPQVNHLPRGASETGASDSIPPDRNAGTTSEASVNLPETRGRVHVPASQGIGPQSPFQEHNHGDGEAGEL